MNYKNHLLELGDRFIEEIQKAKDVQPIPTPEYGWENRRYSSHLFRMAHVEKYTDDKVNVLHVTTFPHKDSPEPIYGFDVITTSDSVIGCYMDFSPGLIPYDFNDGIVWINQKPKPYWATVFSDQFILIKPENDEEFIRFTDWALEKYVWYLTKMLPIERMANETDVINAQNRYCEVQATNPRTYNVLKAKLGEKRARHFMTEILFPKIK
jgi:hypothetical protein